MGADHKRKLKALNEQIKPDTTVNSKPFTIWLANMLIKYGRKALFLSGVILFVLGALGEYLDLETYPVYSRARGFPPQMQEYPF